MQVLNTSHLPNYAETRSTVIAKVLMATVSLQYIYNLAFNYTPESVRTAFAGALLVTFLCLAIYAAGRRPEPWQKLIFWSLVLVFVSWMVSSTLAFGKFDLRQAALDVQVYLLVFFLLTFSHRLPLGNLAFWATMVILVGVGFALFGEPILYSAAGTTRPQPITGGDEVIFPTAYFLAANVLIIDTLRRFGILNPRFAWPVLLLGVLAVYLYGVRTTWIILFVYLVGVQFRQSVQFRTQMPLLFAFGLMGLGVFFGLMDFERIVGSPVGTWGSGRVTAFVERLELLAMRDSALFLFGTGPGSDAQATSIWWGLRTSHSDVLNIFTERGVLGFVSLLLFVTALLVKVKSMHGQIVFLATLAASAISNGFYSGNGIAFYYFAAIAIAMSLEQKDDSLARTHPSAPLGDTAASPSTKPG